MAEKRYYWLKISDEFFKDKAIKKLRKIAGGDTYTVIYLKMLLTAVKQDNRLYFEGVENSFAAELALELDEDAENVSVTLNYLISQGMIEVLSEEEFLMTRCNEVVGSETDAARRMRKLRSGRRITAKKPTAIEGKKPANETQLQLFARLAGDYQISEKLKEKLGVWFRYKAEKKDTYKEQGMKSLLKKVEEKAGRYGDEAIIALIDMCMSSNWKGIIWDKLDSRSCPIGIEGRVSQVDSW